MSPNDQASYRRVEREKARELKRSQWWTQLRGQGRCWHCGEQFPPAELTMDHRLPLALGGRTTKKNVVPSCKACNTRKGAQDLSL